MGIYERKVINAKASAEFCEITPIFFFNLQPHHIFMFHVIFESKKFEIPY